MILSECIDVESQIRMLISNGWFEDARNAATLCRQHGLISAEAFADFSRALAAKPASANARHELYGCAIGFDSNTVLSSLQFERLTSKEDMKKAFKQAVNKLEIETSSQCNRRCTYCPNSDPAHAHRREKNEFLDMNLFKRMLADLQEIDYDQKISLVGMNEFFMHEENFAYLETAKRMLPKSHITIYSNGDYITGAYLERAEKAGLDMLVVSFHLQAGKPYNIEDVLDRTMKFSKNTGVLLALTDFARTERVHLQGDKGRLHIMAGLVNWAAAGHNWAGAVSTAKPGACDGTPCQSPVNILCLTQKGDFTLCCVVPRERTPENIANGAVLGNLADYPSIFHAYAGDAMLYWRQHAFSTKHVPALCRSCSGRNAHSNVLNRKLAEYVETQHRYVKQPAAEAEPLKRAAGAGS